MKEAPYGKFGDTVERGYDFYSPITSVVVNIKKTAIPYVRLGGSINLFDVGNRTSQN